MSILLTNQPLGIMMLNKEDVYKRQGLGILFQRQRIAHFADIDVHPIDRRLVSCCLLYTSSHLAWTRMKRGPVRRRHASRAFSSRLPVTMHRVKSSTGTWADKSTLAVNLSLIHI